jgi:polyribonucleotide nucleotidyltransferase
MDTLTGSYFNRFMLHYNFPSFSVGEVRRIMGPGRREIGHGYLARCAVEPSVPPHDDFPYTVRIVSDTLESNGSSSMAAVCGASLALMDAGVPVNNMVAGIAMGLVKEGDKYAVLSDISGTEDHLGDMDFKVAGTADGINALQMDNKVGGITRAILQEALSQAHDGRNHILGEMAKAISEPRSELNENAPRIVTMKIHRERIRDVIGPGGKTIRGICEATGATVNVEDDGTVRVASSDADAMARAIRMIEQLTQEAEVGKLYLGMVRKVTDFGAFVEIFPGTDGLVHISQLAHERVERVTDVVNEGEEVLVKCIEVDSRSGKIRLSRKEALGDGIDDL